MHMSNLQRLTRAAERSILRIYEIEAVLGDKQYIHPAVIDAIIEYYDSQIAEAEAMEDCGTAIKNMEDRVLSLQLIQKQIRKNGELMDEDSYLVGK